MRVSVWVLQPISLLRFSGRTMFHANGHAFHHAFHERCRCCIFKGPDSVAELPGRKAGPVFAFGQTSEGKTLPMFL